MLSGQQNGVTKFHGRTGSDTYVVLAEHRTKVIQDAG